MVEPGGSSNLRGVASSSKVPFVKVGEHKYFGDSVENRSPLFL